MMQFMWLLPLFSMAARLVGAEFYSDVDTKDRDEVKALEIKAKDFWQGLMDSAQGLETTRNAKLSAQVEVALKTLPSEDTKSRELFLKAIEHLANADSMLFEEASRSKMLALQRLENGGKSESFCDFVSDWEDYLYTAYTQFVGHRTYEKKLARHILSRLKEMEPAIDRAVGMAPEMYEESEKASIAARTVLRRKDLSKALRERAHDIIRATGKQRMRFQNYLLGSLMTTAQDLAGETEQATHTVSKASLRGVDAAAPLAKPFQIELQEDGCSKDGCSKQSEEKKMVAPNNSVDAEPPLIFFDGVPIDAKPITV